MVRNLSKKLPVLLAPLALIALVFVIVFGISHAKAIGMERRSDGTMNGCLFDSWAKICNMSFSEHLSRLEGMFTAIPSKTSLLILLFMLISAIGAFAVSASRQHPLFSLKHLSARWRFYRKQNPQVALFDPLREAFSQGILNPRIYNSAVL